MQVASSFGRKTRPDACPMILFQGRTGLQGREAGNGDRNRDETGEEDRDRDGTGTETKTRTERRVEGRESTGTCEGLVEVGGETRDKG